MKKAKKSKKKEEMEEENESEEREEESNEEEKEEEDEEMADKSLNVNETDLEKALGKMEELIASDDPATRKSALLKKAETEDLSKSEQDELFTILGGKPESTETLGEEITKGLDENETLRKAFEVSEFLRDQNAELTKSLSGLADHIEASGRRQNEFNLVLAKAITETAKLVKSVSDAVEAFSEQPVRGPKSKLSGAQPLKKSFGSQPEGGDEMSKSEVTDALFDLMEKGDSSVTPVTISQFEQYGQLPSGLVNKIRRYKSA